MSSEKQVLIVEDNGLVKDIYKDYFENLWLSPEVCTNLKCAKDKIDTILESWKDIVILLDNSFPTEENDRTTNQNAIPFIEYLKENKDKIKSKILIVLNSNDIHSNMAVAEEIDRLFGWNSNVKYVMQKEKWNNMHNNDDPATKGINDFLSQST